MNSRRRFVLLGAVATVLAALYAIGLLVNRQPAPPVVVPAFRTSLADRIVAGSAELRKQAGGWQLAIGSGWYPANASRVDRLLNTLSGLTAERVAARSRAYWPTFRVDRPSASVLAVSAGERRLVDLYVGETSSGGGVFVRDGNGPEVYEVSGRLAGYVSGSSGYWSYLKILPKSLHIDSLQTIAVSAHNFSVGGESVNTSYLLATSVVNGKSAWVVSGDGRVELDQQKVLDLEGEIVDMVGDSFATGKDPRAIGFGHPTATITVSDQQGGKWTLLIGDRYGAQFYLKRRDKPYVYLVNEWTLHRAIPSLSSLTAKVSKGS